MFIQICTTIIGLMEKPINYRDIGSSQVLLTPNYFHYTMKLGYNKLLGTVQICSLKVEKLGK